LLNPPLLSLPLLTLTLLSLLLAGPLQAEEMVIRLTDVTPSSSMAGVRGPVDLFLEFEAGSAVEARATVKYGLGSKVPNGNGAHTAVDASGLTLSSGTLSGTVSGVLPLAGTTDTAPYTATLAATVSDGLVTGTHSGTYDGTAVAGTVEGTSVAEMTPPAEAEVSLFLENGMRESDTTPTGVPLGLHVEFSAAEPIAVTAFSGRMQATVEPVTNVVTLVGPMGERTYGLGVENKVSGSGNASGSLDADHFQLALDVSMAGRTFTYELSGILIGHVIMGHYDVFDGAVLLEAGVSFLGHAGGGGELASRESPELALLHAGPNIGGAGFAPPYFGALSPAAIRERVLAGALWLTETPEVSSFGSAAAFDIEATKNKRYDNAAYNTYGAAVAFGLLSELADDGQLQYHARKAGENAGYWLDAQGQGNYRGIATYYKQMFYVSVWGAFGHMDLYETTGDARWLEAVKGYMTMLEDEVTNRMDGPEVHDFPPDDGVPAGRTWTYLSEESANGVSPGDVGRSNSRNDRSRDNVELNPGTFLWLLGKLRVDHGVTDFAAFEANAAAWVADNIDDADIWDGGSAVSPADGALFYGLYMLDYAPVFDAGLLDKVLQYVETELTDWSHPVSEDGLTDDFAPHVKNKLPRWVSGYYPEFVGGTASTSRAALLYLKRYERTSNPTDLEKAQALAHSVLRTQKPENGMIHQVGVRDFSVDHEIRLLIGPNGGEIDPIFNPTGRKDMHPYSGIKANTLRNLLTYADALEDLGLDCDQPQEIVATTVINKEPGDAPFGLTATATSGLPVSYQLVYGPASFDGATVTLDGTPGIVKLIASQEGDATWCAATPVAIYISIGDNTPAAPGDLVATAGSASTISLSWTDNADNELRYRIERRLQSETDWATLTLLAADTSAFTDTGLPMETAYEYRVIAETLVAESAPTATVGAATPGDEVYIYLEVECGEVGTGYEIRENPDAGGGIDVVAEVDQFDRDNLDPETIIDYEFFVPRTGVYNLWLRGRAINGGASDSIWLMVDDGIHVNPGVFYTHSICNTGYCWRPNNDSFLLEAGMHKITIASRETEAVLDRFLVTTDTADLRNFGIGGAAVNCGSAEAPQLSLQWDADLEDFALSFFAKEGVVYQLETTTTLEAGDWQASGPPIEGTGEAITLRRFPAGERNFFRIVLQ
jgi:hypothetical protein